MVQVGENINVGGHRVTRIPAKSSESWQYECRDCGTRGDNHVFTVGIDACPGRPESLNELTVCPGGAGCITHMDQTTRAWQMWKASSSMPASDVPHYVCEATERGKRAAAHFLSYAERSGMTVNNWTTPESSVSNVNSEGVMVAEFDHPKGHYEVWVGRTGMLTALRVRAAA